MPHVRRFSELAEFRRLTFPFLLENEAANSLPLRILGGFTQAQIDRIYLAACFENERPDSRIVGVALQTPPYNLVLAFPCPPEALEAFAGEEATLRMPGVIAVAETAEGFAALWQARTGGTLQVTMRLGTYELTQLQSMVKVAGKLRAATADDLLLASRWIQAFHEEALPDSPPADTSDLRGYYLWDVDGVPKSAVRALPSTPNGGVINSVYTPPEFRGRGFASAAVVEATALLLQQGCKVCFLFTDLANPTSNSIYQRIGYRRLGDFKTIRFEV